MVKRPTGSGGEPSSPNCGASAGVRLVTLFNRLHHGAAMPALLETAFYQLTTNAYPTTLLHVLQYGQKRTCPGFLKRVLDPDFGQALIGRQFASGTAKELALDAGVDTLGPQPVRPQRGHEQIGGLGEAWHGQSIRPAPCQWLILSLETVAGGQTRQANAVAAIAGKLHLGRLVLQDTRPLRRDQVLGTNAVGQTKVFF